MPYTLLLWCFIVQVASLEAPLWQGSRSCSPDEDGSGDEALSMLQHRAHGIAKHKPPRDTGSVGVGGVSLADACIGPGGNRNWYMQVVEMITNNLGGLGPETFKPKEMRLQVELGTGKGVIHNYDLVITNTTAYYPKDPSKNGLIEGVRDFFRINTRGKSTTRFQARFVDRATGKKVELDEFFITWYDIDKTKTSLHEKLLVKDYARYTLTDSTKLFANMKDAGPGWKMFSTKENFKGTGVDFDPEALTRKQFDVSVLLRYTKFSKFDFKLKTTGSKTVGRNYMFSGTTKLFRECNAFDCDLWGDPHISGFDQRSLALQELYPRESLPFAIRSFDRAISQIAADPEAEQLSFEGSRSNSSSGGRSSDNGDDAASPGDLREGDMWLVKSGDVYIQGRFGLANGGRNSFLKAVAVGGPFLRGNTLILGTNDGISMWNDDAILETMNATFKTTINDGRDSVFARFHSAVQHIAVPNRTTTGVDVSLPSGVQLVINRFDTWLGLRVHMSPRDGGQDGECGNFNGDPHDDNLAKLQQRMKVRVQEGEGVFHMPFNTWKARHEEEESLLQAIAEIERDEEDDYLELSDAEGDEEE
mmetsp:Transcript_48785/g.115953  ORF Transcript_48785/g.115953 Transcript_48785/m.115953 type:complete len:589 (-) Transcript_48785:140-1906(-)